MFPSWDYTNDQQYQDGAAEALLNDGPLYPDDLVPALYDAQVPQDEPSWSPEVMPDNVAEFLALVVAGGDELFAAQFLADDHAVLFVPDAWVIESTGGDAAELVASGASVRPVFPGPRSVYWTMRENIQGFSPGGPRDQDVRLGYRERR